MIPAPEALARLIEGNRRFVAGERRLDSLGSEERRRELLKGQEPFAVVLGCSDSRVPAEIVFDQGLGDLFVIRVAGNVVAPSLVGSVEFAVQRFGTRLVVVLGHSQCGAVGATLDELRRAGGELTGALSSIVERIKPAVRPLLEDGTRDAHEDLARRAVRANVRASVADLRAGSDLLDGMTRASEIMIVGAEYSLETGEVDFFHGAPERG
jgi:carbonic anhydrase